MKRILSLTAAAFMMVAAPALAGDTPAPDTALRAPLPAN